MGERDAVLRAPRAGDARLDRREVEVDHLRVDGMVVGVVPEQVLLAVGLDQREPALVAAGHPQVAQRLVVHGEEAAGRAVLRRHVPDRGPVGQRELRDAVAEVLHELPDHTGLAKDLGHREHEIGRRRALGQPAREPEADHLRDEHRERLAEHRRLRLDPADAPAEHSEPVHHRRVRVGADEGVGECPPVARLDDAGEVLEVDLVDDARVGRDDLEVVEGGLAPAKECVALAVALELALGVVREGEPRGECVDLHGVVDHELRREQRVDQRRIAAEVLHRVAHRGEVDDRRDAGEVLVEDARGREGDLAARLGVRDPAGDGLDLLVSGVAEHVLEQDPQRVGEARDVVRGLERVDAEDLVGLVSDGELRRRCHLMDSIRATA